MSLILTNDINSGMDAYYIYAPYARFFIRDKDIKNSIMNISGIAENPLICAVRFIGCHIYAEDMSAFVNCYFDDDCVFRVKEFQVARLSEQAVTIKNNRVPLRELGQ